MTVLLKTVDQVPGAPTVDGPELSFQMGQVTAREIVRARVTAEVEGAEPAPRALLSRRAAGLTLCAPADLVLRAENVRLPFEGDDTLSIILSKAFMLADDDKIKNASINSRICAARRVPSTSLPESAEPSADVRLARVERFSSGRTRSARRDRASHVQRLRESWAAVRRV